MSRPGFSVKELSAILDIHPGSVTAAMDPGLRKVARLMIHNPALFFETLQPFLREEERRLADLTTEAELPARVRIQTGQMDRSELHPSSRGNGKP